MIMEIEKLIMTIQIELQELQNLINSELNTTKKLSDITDLLDKEKHLDFMINRLEEFKQSEMDTLEKVQYDCLDN